ncbi:hypothetical protein VTK56DRAFT_4096 [Thermocarpiscus australiensis]
MTRSTGRSVHHISTETETEAETERTPLLAGPPAEQQEDAEDPTNDRRSHLRSLLRPRVILLSLALIFCVELGAGMMVSPATAVMESIICRQIHPDVFLPSGGTGNGKGGRSRPGPGPGAPLLRHFAGGLVLADDPACKHPDVQGYLAMLRGWAATFDCIPGVIGALPYGVLSDRWGRRPVLGLGLLGIVLSVGFQYGVFFFSDVVPLWAMWFSAVFQLIGGGGAIAMAMLYTSIADVVAVDDRATVFLQVGAVFLGSQMIAGPLGGVLMVWNPWIPLLLALAILALSNLLVVLAFPETVHVHDGRESRGDRNDDGVPNMAKLWQKARAGLADVWDFVLANKSVAFLMLSLVFVFLGRFVGELLLQYATERYHWTWSTASIVLAIRSAGSLVTLLVLLPVAGWLCVQRLGMAGMDKDLWLGRWSGIVMIAGSLLIAAAANGLFFSFGLVLFALGSGMSGLIRSLLNALVEEHHVGTVNTLAGFMEVVGMTVVGPLLAESLKVGLDMGGAWEGLPFITAGLFFLVSTAILWSFRLPNRRQTSIEPSC